MSNYIDQDPNNNHSTPTEDYDAERVSTSIGDSGGTTPIYPGWEPERIDKEPKNRNKLAAAFALGGVAATAIIGGAAYFGIRSVANDQVERLTGNETLSSAPVNPGLQTQEIYTDPALLGRYDSNGNGQLDREERDVMAPSDYLNIDLEVRASDRAERFETYMPGAYEYLKTQLEGEEIETLSMPDLEKPRSQWTDQDYLNYESIAVWLITSQDNTPEGKAEALRALSSIANPDTNLYNFVVKWLDENPGRGYKEIYKARPESKVFNQELKDIEVGPYAIGPEGGRLAAYTSLNTGSENYTLYVNTDDNNGNVLSTSMYTYDTIDHPDLRELVNRYGRNQK